MHVHVYGICADKSREYVCTYISIGNDVIAAYAEAIKDARRTNSANRYVDYTVKLAHDPNLTIEGEPNHVQ